VAVQQLNARSGVCLFNALAIVERSIVDDKIGIGAAVVEQLLYEILE
jgi:hypothetical protein